MDLPQKVQKVLARTVGNGTECGCQTALLVKGKLSGGGFQKPGLTGYIGNTVLISPLEERPMG